MNDQEQAMWGSHLPALVACVAETRGDVLELGVGNFSTPVLHALCGAMGRELTSVEADREWLGKMAAVYSRSWHRFYCDVYDNICATLALKDWGVVFVDSSPGGEARAKLFSMFLPRAEFVVVHDYHKDNEEAIGPLLTREINHIVTRRQEPPTLVASMRRTMIIHDL